MDTCVRNLNFVQHIAALNSIESRAEMNDRGRFRAGIQADVHEEEVLCPKPRRMALSCCAPEFIKPMRQWQSSPRILECEAGYEILEIFLNKSACGEGDLSNFGCSPPFCSPPSRASNPIVHDVVFCNQRTSPPMMFTKPKTITGPSFSPSPSIRIEGFDCSRRDVRCDVHAFA